MKYCTLLVLIILSATTIYIEQAKAFPDQKSRDNITLLFEAVSTVRQGLDSQKGLLEEQQKRIVALKNFGDTTKSELLSQITSQEQATEELRVKFTQSSKSLEKMMTKAEQAIKNLRKTLSGLSAQGKQRSILIKQQATAIGVLQGALDEHKNNQNRLLKQQSERIGSLESALKASQSDFTGRVESVKLGVSETKTQLNTLGQGMGDKVKQLGYWIGLVALLGLMGVVVGIIVRKKLASSRDQLEDNLSRMRTQMEEENVKLDSKLVELLQSQLKLVQEQPSAPVAQVSPTEVEVDHALPLRVGEEIIRLRQRVKTMPDGTKGLRPMLKSLERLEDEFNKKGYEIVDMLGKPFDDRLNVQARLIPSDDLSPGERIINKIIKPQINFNGATIQVAEIEVITGE